MRKIVLLVIILFLVASCTKLENIRTEEPTVVSPPSKKEALPFKPIIKRISPLDNKYFTLSAKGIDYKVVLYEIAKDAGLNLIIEEDADLVVPKDAHSLTMNFIDLPLKQALDILTKSNNLFYEVKENVLYIKGHSTMVFHLDFISHIRSSTLNVGGDVLGGIATENVTNPLTGNYALKGSVKESATDVYKQMEETIKAFLSEDGKYSLDRLTSTLVVYDQRKNLDRISIYIENVKKAYTRQVLIETRIIEVILNEDNELGIDWQAMGHKILNRKFELNMSQTLALSDYTFSVGVAGIKSGVTGDKALLTALSTCGRVRIVSNPRVRALNGQPALISVGKSVSYIKKLEYETETTGGELTIRKPTVEISSIFDGILLGVTPYISKDGDILLSITPIKSDIESLKEVKIGDNVYTLPYVNLRETSTVVKAKSGDIVILSGLIGRKESKTESKVPILGDIPVAGNVFKQQVKTIYNIELVIFIKPRII
ncbi:MAG: hypothetical protein J7J73_01580 [Deltaproteobacteria bacterium]|nr:hypothetical protein [Deltaproteobacteria bacterium]